MEASELKKMSVSNLILIILNDKNKDLLRKFAEIELKKRIKNYGWQYDDLLHFDDKVIKERGLDISNYLISPNVNMQQLMETYFMFDKDANYDSNYLLFSEKHLCNEVDAGEPFFRKICSREIKNLDKRIKGSDTESQKQLLMSIKQMLLNRQKVLKQVLKENLSELLFSNEAMYQFEGAFDLCHESYNNISDEELYDLMSTRRGMLKARIMEMLDESLYELDLPNYLHGLKFVKRDSSKLNKQKRQLLSQVNNGYEVNYESETMQKALLRLKK